MRLKHGQELEFCLMFIEKKIVTNGTYAWFIGAYSYLKKVIWFVRKITYNLAFQEYIKPNKEILDCLLTKLYFQWYF